MCKEIKGVVIVIFKLGGMENWESGNLLIVVFVVIIILVVIVMVLIFGVCFVNYKI